jgi:hypothetical protein
VWCGQIARFEYQRVEAGDSHRKKCDHQDQHSDQRDSFSASMPGPLRTTRLGQWTNPSCTGSARARRLITRGATNPTITGAIVGRRLWQ